MKTYNFDDPTFQKTDLYKNFIINNSSTGFLKIRAYAASGAIPISNIKIEISKTFDNTKIIFFNGLTNISGIIEKIALPAPKLSSDNLTAPSGIKYDITATYLDNTSTNYEVNIFENIYVIQTINIVPTLNVMKGDN